MKRVVVAVTAVVGAVVDCVVVDCVVVDCVVDDVAVDTGDAVEFTPDEQPAVRAVTRRDDSGSDGCGQRPDESCLHCVAPAVLPRDQAYVRAV